MAFDFSTSSARVDAVLEEPAGNPRGRALQDLVDEMLGSLPGVDVADRNVLAGQGDAELDLMLVNAADPGGLPAFGRDALVECKSSADGTSSREVEHFIKQIERRQLSWSIFVSLAGITGEPEQHRHAHESIRDAMKAGHGIVLLVEHELRALRSPEHLSAVIEKKRIKLVGRLRTEILSPEELEELGPALEPDVGGGVAFRRGPQAMADVMRHARERAFNEIREAALALSERALDVGIAQARRALESVAAEITDHRENPDEDPMWLKVHAAVLHVGACFARLLDEPLDDPHEMRVLLFELRASVPQKLNAHAGGRLWTLLVDYYLEEIGTQSTHARRTGAMAVIGMCIDEMIAIDDIDPRDVFEDYDDHYDGP